MKKRFVIYSACTHRYDALEAPQETDDRFDYILFSDTLPAEAMGAWEVRSIPFRHDDPAKTARWVKCHPETLLSDYDASVWIDSNIRILDPSVYDEILAVLDSPTLVSSLRHPQRDCIYQEMMTVMASRLDTESTLLQWGHRLRSSRYPIHNGLSETGLLIRKHNDPRVVQLDRIWWDCIAHYSRRDQLSFDYALWRCHLDRSTFLDGDIRQDPRFVLHTHTSGHQRQLPLQHPSRLYRYLMNRPEQRDTIAAAYYAAYRSPLPRWAAAWRGQWLRFKLRGGKTKKV